MPSRANNFDTLRIVAALSVLWSHVFGLTMGPGANEPIELLSGGQMTLGDIALAVFFVISGYLITQSFVQSSSMWRFVRARILRIMPGLVIVLILLGLIVGPLVTTVPLSEYFSSASLYRYLILNASLLDFHDILPGVFAGNPQPYANGSLWTLRIEAECYLVVFVFGFLGLMNRYVMLMLFLAGLLYVAFDGPYTLANLREQNQHIYLGTQFLAGAVIYHWRLKLNGIAAITCMGVSILALLFGGLWLALPTLFAYAVIYLALGPVRLPNMARYGDLSYGMYIYAWPVSQLIIMYSATPTWYWVGSIATLIVVLLAFLSWHFIEKVALSFKDHMPLMERRLSENLDRAAATVRSKIFGFLPRRLARAFLEPN